MTSENQSKREDCCSVCGGPLVEKKLKRFCKRCGQLCETCCDGGGEPHHLASMRARVKGPTKPVEGSPSEAWNRTTAP